MAPECILLCSEQKAMCLYLEQGESNSCCPLYYLSICAEVFQVVSFHQVSLPQPCTHPSSGSFYFLPKRHKCHPQHPILECCLCSVPASTYIFMKLDNVFLFIWDKTGSSIAVGSKSLKNWYHSYMCVLLLSGFVFWLTKVFAFAGTLDVVFGEIDR